MNFIKKFFINIKSFRIINRNYVKKVGKDVYSKDIFDHLYRECIKLNYFENPYKCVPQAFNFDIKNAFINYKTGLPMNNARELVNYCMQFFQYAYNMHMYSTIMLIQLMLTDYETKIDKCINEQIDFIAKTSKNPINRDELYTKIKNTVNTIKYNDNIIKVIYNTYISQIYSAEYMRNYMLDTIKQFEKTNKCNTSFTHDPLYDFLSAIISRYVKINNNSVDEYKRFSRKMSCSLSKFEEIRNYLHIKFLFLIHDIKNMFLFLFTNRARIDAVEAYKNQLFNMNFDNIKYFQDKFIKECNTLKTIVETFKSEDFQNLNKEMFECISSSVDRQKLEAFSKKFEDNFDKIATLDKSSIEFFMFTNNTIKELLIQHDIVNKVYNN